MRFYKICLGSYLAEGPAFCDLVYYLVMGTNIVHMK